MKKYKSLFVSSVVLSLVLLSPIATFADNDRDGEKDKKQKSEKFEKDYRNGFYWGKFQSWMNRHKNKNVEVVISAPVISNLAVSSIKQHKATIKWATDIKADGSIWYSKTSPVDTTGKAILFRNLKTLDHKLVLNQLDANTKYYVIVKSTNSKGTTTSQEVTFTTLAETVVTPTPVDTTKPVISDVQTLVSATTGNVSWKTDEPTNATVYYSTITPLDVNASTTLSVTNTSLTKNHSLNIPSLASGTIYHFIIKSADASNNTAVSSEHSLITN